MKSKDYNIVTKVENLDDDEVRIVLDLLLNKLDLEIVEESNMDWKRFELRQK
jgi:hypothetical protein